MAGDKAPRAAHPVNHRGGDFLRLGWPAERHLLEVLPEFGVLRRAQFRRRRERVVKIGRIDQQLYW